MAVHPDLKVKNITTTVVLKLLMLVFLKETVYDG